MVLQSGYTHLVPLYTAVWYPFRKTVPLQFVSTSFTSPSHVCVSAFRGKCDLLTLPRGAPLLWEVLLCRELGGEMTSQLDYKTTVGVLSTLQK